MDWVTTSTILEELRDYSNAAAWDDFVNRFRDPIVRFASSLGFDSSDAQDIAQDALLAFAEKLRSGRYDRARGRLHSWLFGIVYRQALKQRDANRRRDRHLAGAGADLAAAELPDEKTLDGLWDMEWERFVVLECFRQARREFRPESLRAFELVVREDRSAQEAAEELGIPIKSVYNAKHRVLKRMRELRAELEEVG